MYSDIRNFRKFQTFHIRMEKPMEHLKNILRSLKFDGIFTNPIDLARTEYFANNLHECFLHTKGAAEVLLQRESGPHEQFWNNSAKRVHLLRP